MVLLLLLLLQGCSIGPPSRMTSLLMLPENV
jgi:hypothetical protein